MRVFETLCGCSCICPFWGASFNASATLSLKSWPSSHCRRYRNVTKANVRRCVRHGMHRCAHGEPFFVEYRNLFACLFMETQPGRRQEADVVQIQKQILKRIFLLSLSLSLYLTLPDSDPLWPSLSLCILIIQYFHANWEPELEATKSLSTPTKLPPTYLHSPVSLMHPPFFPAAQSCGTRTKTKWFKSLNDWDARMYRRTYLSQVLSRAATLNPTKLRSRLSFIYALKSYGNPS